MLDLPLLGSVSFEHSDRDLLQVVSAALVFHQGVHRALRGGVDELVHAELQGRALDVGGDRGVVRLAFDPRLECVLDEDVGGFRFELVDDGLLVSLELFRLRNPMPS